MLLEKFPRRATATVTGNTTSPAVELELSSLTSDEIPEVSDDELVLDENMYQLKPDSSKTKKEVRIIF
jgi:hypothetical protein